MNNLASTKAIAKRSAETQKLTARPAAKRSRQEARQKQFLSKPVNPVEALRNFLSRALPLKNELNAGECEVEIEARIGVLGLRNQKPPQRVASSKSTTGGHIFDCSDKENDYYFESDVSKSHFSRSRAYLRKSGWIESDTSEETVFVYGNGERAVFPGAPTRSRTFSGGRRESKTRRDVLHLTIPEAPFDVRVCSSNESVLKMKPHSENYHCQRIKRRQSYIQENNPWRIDLTQVTTRNKQHAPDENGEVELSYEIEVELQQGAVEWLQGKSSHKWDKWMQEWASQLWDILQNVNPITSNNIDVMLQEHPSKEAQALALERCRELRDIANPAASRKPLNTLPGCMPVNFARRHLDKLQWGICSSDYYLSEKTDGVRYWLVFTDGTTAVLVDRDLKCKQPIGENPFGSILPSVQPGTVLDGEVVLNRRASRPRAVFIVFDVLSISKEEKILSLPFADRLDHLRRASFCTKLSDRKRFFEWNDSDPLPLLRKDFVQQTEIDQLLSNIEEDRGKRFYRLGVHDHLTDGIIFQPNLPYVCGTDKKLFKWKYHDMLTIDVKLTNFIGDSANNFRVIVGGSEGNVFDVVLPKSERMRMEADRALANREANDCIAEIGFDPDEGEWYYVCIRSDKKVPNAIKTVVGTLQELAERLTEEELQKHLSVPKTRGRPNEEASHE